MMDLIDYCKDHDLQQVMQLPDIKERVDLFKEHEQAAKEQIQRCSKTYKNCVVLDLRNEEIIFAANRFMIYAMFPDCNISVHVMWGLKQQNTVLAIGKSILNRSSNTNVGELCLRYAGGGHLNAGTCQVNNENNEQLLQEIIQKIKNDG